MTIIHPYTGVELNSVEKRRTRLEFDDAVTAFIMRAEGEQYTIIAQKLGTNPIRLSEVFNEKAHKGAQEVANHILSKAA